MNSTRHILRLGSALIFASAAVFAACDHTTPTSSTPDTYATRQGVANNQSPSTRGSQADARVVDQLTTARCDRENTCNNVGDGRKYASRQVCIDQMRGSVANDLNPYKCPRGIDRANLDACLTAIQSEECGHPLDTLSRIDKCRAGALCLE
ncbi:MAG TPA: DUF6184 family natural product biosynthesis lipoprotein [Polyangiaceae bacterium]|nr:DUF6184 family natural product biosynthesis lipoprotein [Polyangiaceae bacterium]